MPISGIKDNGDLIHFGKLSGNDFLNNLDEFFIRPGDWNGFPSSEYAFPSKF